MERICTASCLAVKLRIEALELTGAALNDRLLPTQQTVRRAVESGARAESLLDIADGILQCNGVGCCGASVDVPA